jgi:hypothetical protein
MEQWGNEERDRPPCLVPLLLKRSLGVHVRGVQRTYVPLQARVHAADTEYHVSS